MSQIVINQHVFTSGQAFVFVFVVALICFLVGMLIGGMRTLDNLEDAIRDREWSD